MEKMELEINQKEKQFIIDECLNWLDSTKDCDAKPDGEVTIDNYNQFKKIDFMGAYGLSSRDYDVIISLLNKLKI